MGNGSDWSSTIHTNSKGIIACAITACLLAQMRCIYIPLFVLQQRSSSAYTPCGQNYLSTKLVFWLFTVKMWLTCLLACVSFYLRYYHYFFIISVLIVVNSFYCPLPKQTRDNRLIFIDKTVSVFGSLCIWIQNDSMIIRG